MQGSAQDLPTPVYMNHITIESYSEIKIWNKNKKYCSTDKLDFVACKLEFIKITISLLNNVSYLNTNFSIQMVDLCVIK